MLTALAMTAAGMGLAGISRLLDIPVTDAQGAQAKVFLPLVTKPQSTPTATATATRAPATATATATSGVPPTMRGRVIHIRSLTATTWTGSPSNYWDYVNTSKVNEMVNRGVMELTGRGTVADAWRALLPNYQAGQKIAIKVNFNNQMSISSCSANGTAIDAIIEPVNAIVNGLAQIGVAAGNIWVFDAMRKMPNRFVSRGVTGVQYYDNGECRQSLGFGSTVTFSPPAGVPPPTERISTVLAQATYLINMPIMKNHSCTGVTLGFKNHLGSIDDPGGMHYNAFLLESGCGGTGGYRTNYNVLVDLYRHANIGPKTILTVGDGLFACIYQENLPPQMWTTFGNRTPQSLYFAVDPVAIDCVMCDFLAAESGDRAGADNYLRLASNAGLGVFERGNPWTTGYSSITYRKFDI
jgi:hypothetical protein